METLAAHIRRLFAVRDAAYISSWFGTFGIHTSAGFRGAYAGCSMHGRSSKPYPTRKAAVQAHLDEQHADVLISDAKHIAWPEGTSVAGGYG